LLGGIRGIVFTNTEIEKLAQPTPSSPSAATVVIADEAHRSHDFIDGFAKHMRDALPKASCWLYRHTD
jgi:type I restriction enzyme R subunit